MASKYIAPPIHLPESQLYQRKDGGTGGTAGASSGLMLTDSNAQIMRVQLNPLINCFWRIRAGAIWHITGATGAWNASGWLVVRTRVLVQPADADGIEFIGDLDTQLHNEAPDWRGVSMAGNLRLNAGTLYSATLQCSHLSHFPGAMFWRGAPYLYIEGETFGHGSF